MEEENKEAADNLLVVETPKEESQTVVPTVEKEPPVELGNLQDQYLREQIKRGANVTEIATDFTKARVTNDIINSESKQDNKFRKELAEEQKETLKQSFVQDKVEQQAKTLSARQQKAEAFYVSFRPILEFDFSPLIHKPTERGKTEERSPKTYKDRSYGIPLMCLMLLLLVIPYCIVSIVLALFNGINAILEAIATFGKIARTIATTIFVLIILTLVVYFIMLGIDWMFGTTIISSIKA